MKKELQNYAFCEECFDDVEYEVKDNIPMVETLKNVEYRFIGKEAYCKKCGAIVFVPEINDYNLESLYNVYRAKNGLISLSAIRSIPEKYNIGKRPLSTLLGWGEMTFSRFYDGDVPSKQYSNVLERIYEDPFYYSKLLEAGKDRLGSTLSYKKSRKAVNDLLSTDNKRKITMAAKYLIHECEDITPLAIQKALYYTQGIYSAFYDTFIFNEDCEAWTHGPVYREIYYLYKDYKFNPISLEESSYDEFLFNQDESLVLKAVAKYLCCYSGKILENFTHREKPWVEARHGISDLEYSCEVIQKQSIKNYFTEMKEKYKMIIPDDFRFYAYDMFNELNK